jgi:hypothetical protein
MNDIIFIDTGSPCSSKNWNDLRSRFVYSKKISTSSKKLEDIFKEAANLSLTKSFWVVMDTVSISRTFKFNYKIKEWNKQYVHAWNVFKPNSKLVKKGVYCLDKEFATPLLMLPLQKIAGSELKTSSFSISADVFFLSTGSEKDKNSFLKIKEKFKEVSYIESNNTYDAYCDAFNKAKGNMFWVIWNDLILDKNFDFSFIPPYWDTDYHHVFRNKKYYDGVTLFSKKFLASKREVDYRMFVKKKEINILSSTKSYDIFLLTTDLTKVTPIVGVETICKPSIYEAYVEALQKSTTNMFWIVWDNLIIDSKFNFDYESSQWDSYTHVFRNEKYFDGVTLFSKKTPVSQREVEYRMFVKKKEVNIQSSVVKPFDVVFISFNEKFADENFKKLQSRFPYAKRIHGVRGIHNAHIEAAKIVDTEMFWVVDADAEVLEEFKFDYNVSVWDYRTVHVWRSANPINNLEYGYGGVKLLPTKLTLNMDLSKPDMTTSISPLFKAVDTVSNITCFNTDPFSTWRSAFRECVKLSSKIIDRQDNEETNHRLDIWCSEGSDKKYGEWAILGAKQGRLYGATNIENLEALKLINDYDWLKEQFDAASKTNKISSH